MKIEKIRTNRNRHLKYAVCSIYEKGDWTVYLDYTKMDFLPDEKMDGDTYILDVRTINFKGKKRKLLLTCYKLLDAIQILILGILETMIFLHSP